MIFLLVIFGTFLVSIISAMVGWKMHEKYISEKEYRRQIRIMEEKHRHRQRERAKHRELIEKGLDGDINS